MMKQSFRKIVCWVSALSVYALLVAVVLCQLQESQDNPLAAVMAGPAEFAGQESLQVLLEAAHDGGFSGILLPIGPDDGRLPGLSAVWDEFWRADGITAAIADSGGVDGLQAVKEFADLSQNAVAELFLAGVPRQVFRHDRELLVLNDKGKVQIIDCKQPREPKLSGFLPYEGVKYMGMRGSIAYLLLSPLKADKNVMVVADLSVSGSPRQLVRFDVPRGTLSFYFNERHLVVFGELLGGTGETSIYLYDQVNGDRFVLLGSSGSGTMIKNDFVRLGDYLVIPDLRSGVHVYDFSDPLQPAVAAFLEIDDRVRRFVRYGEKVFAFGTKKRIYVIDLHDPQHPKLTAAVENAMHPVSFVSYGDVTYYFTLQGYLHVVPLQLSSIMREHWTDGLAGELVALPRGGGFSLLGEGTTELPEGVEEVIALREGRKIIATSIWQDGVAVLFDDGLVTFFRQGESLPQELQDRVQLANGVRWLAADGKRLYVGGDAAISVIANDNGQLKVTGRIELPVPVSWDGLVVRQKLYVAAGRDGLLSFALDEPDKPLAEPPWVMPPHLESRVDVRQLAAAGGDRLLVAAGQAGLLDGRIDARGRFQVKSLMAFNSPVSALAVINQLGLVATAGEVRVVDLSNEMSLQNLGQVAFSNVDRLAVAPPDRWAGFVPESGWFVFAAPQFLSSEDFGHLQAVGTASAIQPGHLYRLNLYNDRDVKTLPGFLLFSRSGPGQTVQAGRDGH